MNSRRLITLVLVAVLPLPVSAASSNLPISVAAKRGVLEPQPAGTLSGRAALAPLIQAGHPAPDPLSAILPDSPDLRVDPNTTTSQFAGVGSLFADDDPTDPLGIICTATPIDKWHVLTAGHCLDITNGDGKSDVLPENALFVLNYGAAFSHIIAAAAIAVHPKYEGFAAGINDDLAILTLSEPIPDGVPIYPLAKPNWLAPLEPLTMVGYGTSGDGVNGYTVGPQFSVKRSGANLLEYWEFDDEGGPQVEVVAWDFEYEGENSADPNHPNRFDVFGFPFALPNQEETTLGGGDSGGPSFMSNPNNLLDPNLYLAAVNTFTFWLPGVPDHDERGKFGSGSGGVLLNSEYRGWIKNTVPEASPPFAEILLAAAALLATSRICQASRQS